jgi:acetyltransferase-like isoleucine patch superfamily enzyme
MSAKFFQHPTALVESAAIGAGTRIWAFAHILKGAQLGRHCNVGDHAFIEGGAKVGHRVTIKNGVCIWAGVTIDDDAFVGPNVVFTNDLWPRSPRFAAVQNRYAKPENWLVPTRVGRGASIGANATVLCGITIGKFAMIGAGAVVSQDVPPHALIIGVPGRAIGFVSEAGQRLRFDAAGNSVCPLTGARYLLRAGRISRRAR